MKYIISLLLVLSLSGCFGSNPTKVDQVVYIDHPVLCKRGIINTPTDYPFDRATKQMLLEDKTKLALSELEIRRGYTKELEAALNVCSE